MKLKAKIASTMMSMLLALGVMGFAVWAAATQTLVVNNTVSFVSDHVLASIEGTVTGAVGDNLDADYLGEVDESTSASNKFDAWEIGDISFGNELVPIEIELKITNKSLERFFTFEIDFVNDVIASDNVVRSVTYDATSNEVTATGATYTEGSKVRVDKNTVATVVVTLSIADTGKSVDAFRNDFSVTLLNLGVASEEQQPEFEYDFNDSEGMYGALNVPQGAIVTANNLPDALFENTENASAFYGLYTDSAFENKVSYPYIAEQTKLYPLFEEIDPAIALNLIGDGSEYQVSFDWENGYISETGNIRVPERFEGIPVTVVAEEGFRGLADSFSISLPGTITMIGRYAFIESSLVSITIPASVEVIGESAFEGVFGEVTGGYDPGPMSHPVSAFGASLNTKTFEYGSYASFIENENGSVVSIEENSQLSEIGTRAFANNTFAKVFIPASVKLIGFEAFRNSFGAVAQEEEPIYYAKRYSASIYDFSYNEDVVQFASDSVLEEIGEGAFQGCTAIQNITFPASLKKIGANSFKGAFTGSPEGGGDDPMPASKKLSATTYEGGMTGVVNFAANSVLEEIGYYAFESSGITSITIPNSTKKIDIAFANSSLSEIFFDENTQIEVIAQGAFDGTPYFSNNLGYEENTIYYINGIIAYYSYYGSTHPDQIIVQSGTKVLLDGLFENIWWPVTFHIPSSVTRVNGRVFSASEATIILDSTTEPAWEDGWQGSTPYYWNVQEFASNENYDYIVHKDNTISITKYKGSESVIDLSLINLGRPIVAIGGKAFYGNYTLNSIHLPASVKRIGQSAFHHSGLKSITFATGSLLEKIEASAFAYSTIENIQLPSGLKNINVFAFQETHSLRKIVIPASVTYVSIGAFVQASNLVICIEANEAPTQWNENWNGWNHYYTGVSESGFATVDGIEYFVNNNNKAIISRYTGTATSLDLTTINFGGAALQEIAISAFRGNATLQSIVIPASVEAIRMNAFRESSLQEILFETNSALKLIDDFAFYDCHNLIGIIIPSQVEEIGFQAFANCYKLEKVFIPSSVASVETLAFDKSMQVNVFVQAEALPSNWQENWQGTFYDSSRSVFFGVQSFVSNVSFDYALHSDNTVTIIRFKGSETALDLTTIDGYVVKAIARKAFKDSTALLSVVLPNTVEHIGREAFSGCTALQSISYISTNIKFIGVNAFVGCPNLTLYIQNGTNTSSFDTYWNNEVYVRVQYID